MNATPCHPHAIETNLIRGRVCIMCQHGHCLEAMLPAEWAGSRIAARIGVHQRDGCPTPPPGAPLAAPTVPASCVADQDLRNPDGSFIPCPCADCQRYQDEFRRSTQAIHNNRQAAANGMPSTTDLANAIPDPQTPAAREAAQRADEAELAPTCDTCTSPTLPLFVTVYSDGSQRRECLECRVPRLRAATIGTCVDCGGRADISLRQHYPDVDFGPIRCTDCGWAELEREEATAALAARGLAPMAGGAPSHYTDPAWLADEAWSLQEERNAESAREDQALGEHICAERYTITGECECPCHAETVAPEPHEHNWFCRPTWTRPAPMYPGRPA